MTLVEVERACFENCSLHKLMLRTYTNITVSFDLEQPTMHTRAQTASPDSEEMKSEELKTVHKALVDLQQRVGSQKSLVDSEDARRRTRSPTPTRAAHVWLRTLFLHHLVMDKPHACGESSDSGCHQTRAHSGL